MAIFKNLDEIKKYVKPDDWWTEFVITKFSIRIVSAVENTGITPNQLTMTSFFVALAGAYMIGLDDYKITVIGAVLLQIAYTFDVADGELARYKKKFHPFGAWIDGISDRIKELCIVLSLSRRFYQVNEDAYVWGLYTFFILAMYHGLIGINLPVFSKKDVAVDPSGPNTTSPGILLKLNSLRHKLKLGLFNLGEQVFLCSVFVIINRIDLFFYVFSAYGTIVLILLSILTYKKYLNSQKN